MTIILASGSPRRAQLLEQIGLPFRVEVADIDETPQLDESPQAYVQRLAREKGDAVVAKMGPLDSAQVVLSADTIVVLDGDLLGKPANAEQGQQMLLRLSGRAHEVLTGLCVRRGNATKIHTTSTNVWFRDITSEQAAAYWATGEPQDKAGGYGIQGIGSIFVDKIVGSYSNVVGLPLVDVERLLQELGVATWDLRDRG